MATVVKYQGDDIPIRISMTDATGTPINITNLAELYVYVISHNKHTVLVKFSKAGTGGFEKLVIVSAFLYRADVLSGITKDALPDVYDIDINVVQTDADYESSQKNTIDIQNVFRLNKSVSKIMSSG